MISINHLPKFFDQKWNQKTSPMHFIYSGYKDCIARTSLNEWLFKAKNLPTEDIEQIKPPTPHPDIDPVLFAHHLYPLHMLAKYGLKSSLQPYKNLYIWVNDLLTSYIKNQFLTATTTISYNKENDKQNSTCNLKIILTLGNLEYKLDIKDYTFSQEIVFLTLKFITEHFIPHPNSSEDNLSLFVALLSFIVRSTTSNSLLRFDVLQALFLRANMSTLYRKYIDFIHSAIKFPTTIFVYGLNEKVSSAITILSKFKNVTPTSIDILNNNLNLTLGFADTPYNFKKNLENLKDEMTIKTNLDTNSRRQTEKWQKRLHTSVDQILDHTRFNQLSDKQLKKLAMKNIFTKPKNYDIDYDRLLADFKTFLKLDNFFEKYDSKNINHQLILQIRANEALRQISLLSILHAKINKIQIIFLSDVSGTSIKHICMPTCHTNYPDYIPVTYEEYNYILSKNYLGNIACKLSLNKTAHSLKKSELDKTDYFKIVNFRINSHQRINPNVLGMR
ncbi:MAG: hypothetical protein QG673_832 [Pseudomonadota bacterium]|nr:hypothetical protein [Pseudomonadota bacterium]